MVKRVVIVFFNNKKGEETDSIYSISFLMKILIITAIAVALFFVIKGIANGFLPK